MKSILMSIQPKWCELIASGKKTIEVRKTKPKLDTPFKVYIYETQGRTETPWIDEDGHHIFKGRGQVIGEFICDKIIEIEHEVVWSKVLGGCDVRFNFNIGKACLEEKQIFEYLGEGTGYAWHISDLVIYDKPKELSEFRSICREYDKERPGCGGCDYYYSESNESVGFYEECLCNGMKPLTRPPQSWCYVKEVQP